LHRRIVKKSEAEQEQLRSFVETSGKFDSREKRSFQVDSAAAFARFWNETFDAQHDFEKDHEHGVGRVARAAQNIASSGYDLLSQLQPVVELVRNLGQPYGGIAIGTITFFFAVCAPISTAYACHGG
jgi:hypothetical protein